MVARSAREISARILAKPIRFVTATELKERDSDGDGDGEGDGEPEGGLGMGPSRCIVVRLI